MALFDRKPKGENPDANADSGAGSGKQDSVRKMAGFSGIADVKDKAPESTAGSFSIDSAESPRRGRSRTSAVSTEAQQKATVEAQQELIRLKALEVAGKHILGKIASVPYDAWAMMAADEYYKLKPEQAKELADSYYLIAQGMKMDFSSPLWLIIGVASLHSVLIADRLKHMKQEQDKSAEKNLTEMATRPN